MEAIRAFKSHFDPLLTDFLAKKQADAAQVLEDPLISSYVAQAAKIVTHGGKRARPYIAWQTYVTLGGGDSDEVRRLMIAIELFHTFCLIHDDIMDNGSARHDVATIHTYAEEAMVEAKRLGAKPHVALSQAVLVGDLVASWAWEVLGTAYESFSAEILQKVRNEFSKMSEQVILGQMIDIDITTRSEAPETLITKKMELKTARYTFVQPMKIGAALAGKLTEYDSFCDSVGINLGLAFQIQDDLLDITGDETTVSKTTLRDVVQRQHTCITNAILTYGTAAEKKQLSEVFHSSVITDDMAQRLVLMLRSSKAITSVQQLVRKYYDEARRTIDAAAWEKSTKLVWYNLVEYLKHRTR